MHQLSFAFLQSGRHITELPASDVTPGQPVTEDQLGGLEKPYDLVKDELEMIL
jgi:hypothetical protein